MLIKEYRIPLPLTVEEYRVAQLYMIAKKSREESHGQGSGVEILVNEPYEDGPGGKGQYTHKIYHVGSHLPGWLKALLPKSALTVEEEAWNAYPYTKTRYTCPFVEKFSLEIETKYYNDRGMQENVFNLSSSELRNRVVDEIDVVKDQLYGSDYKWEEDPKNFVSQKTGRGPLEENWLQDYCDANVNSPIMCAYKLCRVEFKYWGMQSKIEKFIHDVALRKTMLRAHRQAWAWQDEWVGLTMEDIRRLEKETQEALAKKMAGSGSDTEGGEGQGNLENNNPPSSNQEVDWNAIDKDNDFCINEDVPTRGRNASPKPPSTASVSKPTALPLGPTGGASQVPLCSPSGSSTTSFDLHVTNWRMESIVRDSDTSSNEEFFDAEDEVEVSPLPRWSSMEAIPADEDLTGQEGGDTGVASSRKAGSQAGKLASSGGSMDTTSLPATPTSSPAHQPCPTAVLVCVLHAGSVLDAGADPVSAKQSDLTTFRTSFEAVTRQHYPALLGRVAFRLVPVPPICAEALSMLSNLSPYSFQASPSAIDGMCHSYDSIPIGALPLFGVSTPEYQEHVSRVVAALNQTYADFVHCEDGAGFTGQVVIVADSVSSILAYDSLCRSAPCGSRFGSDNSINEGMEHPPSPGLISRPNPLISISDGSGNEEDPSAKRSQRTYRKSYSHPQDTPTTTTSSEFSTSTTVTAATSYHESMSLNRLLSAPPLRRRSSGSSDHSSPHRLDFEVSDLFLLGSPLGIVLAFRKILILEDKNAGPTRPQCGQVYNLMHPTDPCAARLEPLLCPRFAQVPPVNVPRYTKYPLGDGQPLHLLEHIQSFAHVFAEPGTSASSIANYAMMGRRTSEASIASTLSGLGEALPLATLTAVTQKWWGTKRVDYALYCPEGLANFPAHALPHLFHASFWESTDVIAFILRQLTRTDNLLLQGDSEKGDSGGQLSSFTPTQPREKWVKKRTSVKLKNMTANHRANDVIVKEGAPQVLSARFVYGPLDMVALTGEKIDIHIIKDLRAGEWKLLSTEVTDKTGRLVYTIPKEQALGYGMYPVKMVVRGDHTSVDFFLTVVPPQTECAVFSIDGSFTASMSVMGKDPKVRAGAVDVVRHWQELGYLIIYITGRPDMQQQRVVSWLAQHNFPHGLVSFADGLSIDPLRHKADYLRQLQREADIVVHVAYGSSKDIWVYSSIGLKPSSIYIVGKVSKKHHSMATILSDGYAAHLSDLKAPGASRPAQGNARMVLPRGCFGLPGQGSAVLRQRRSAKRTTSYPLSGDLRNTT